MIELDEETASQLAFCEVGEDFDGWRVEDVEDWYDAGKYQFREIIFSSIEDNKLYKLDVSRTGSYYSDYFYDYTLKCPEVVRKERVITQVYYEEKSNVS